MNQEALDEATKLVKEGKITQSIQAIQREVANRGLTYSLASNLGALHLQLGDYQTAINYSSQAIALDPYSYAAYFNRFLCCFSERSSVIARRQLHKALSCLYLVRGFQQNSLKYLNKAIFYCEQNARAYLVRAKLNEGKNNKLAENDYSAAIEYDPNLPEIYQQRALFYRKLNRKAQFQENLAIYLQLKSKKAEAVTELVDNDGSVFEEADQKIKIQEEIKEFQELLLKIHPKGDLNKSGEQGEAMGKLPLSSLQSKIERRDEQQLLLSDRAIEESAKTITIKKEEIQFKKRAIDEKIDKNFREIFQDQSSKELDDKIDRLERQIQREGGKISTGEGEEEELDVSDPSNFLTQQIEKAIDQITKLSSPDLAEIRSVKSAASHGSVGSKKSQSKELTQEEFAQFSKVTIEVVSLEDIQNYNRKETSKIQLKYGEVMHQTSMQKCQWREQLSFSLNPGQTELEVIMIEKGGIFRSDKQMGGGTINLLERGTVKCILGNKQKKVAILYFKLKLS